MRSHFSWTFLSTVPEYWDWYEMINANPFSWSKEIGVISARVHHDG